MLRPLVEMAGISGRAGRCEVRDYSSIVENEKALPGIGRAYCDNVDEDYPFSTGAIGLASFTGEEGDSGAAATSPLIRITFVGSLVALLETVTLLLIAPTRLVSYLTVIAVVAPGMIGSVSHFGTVHPQLPLQLVRING